MFHWLFRLTAGKIISLPVRRHLHAFAEATHRPREVQQALLSRILRYHADTDLGRDHHFREIHSAADFRRHLSVVGYEYFEPYLERVRRGQINALLADPVVHMFAMTSGTTAARKFIPVTPQSLADYRRGWNIWGLNAFRDHPEVRMRPIVQMSSDWDEFRTESGVPCGSMTGLTARMQRPLIRMLYCVPGAVGRIKDPVAKYYTAVRLSAHRRVGMILAANPSTLLNLARTGDQEKETLIRDIHDGTLSARFDIPGDIRRALRTRLIRRPGRARAFEEIVRRTGTLYPRDYWPRGALLGTWTGGSVGVYLRHFPQYFGSIPVRDVGLIASEGRMSIPLADSSPGGVLDTTTHYFEFIPEEEGDSTKPVTLQAHEVEEGKTYFIVPTTASGLYRYHISDLVRVTGFFNRTPIIEFLSKGAHFSNLTGEKLSEYQVAQAMREVLPKLDLFITTYSVAPCWDEQMPYYGLFVEEGDLPAPGAGTLLAESLDHRLAELNPEYACKRATLRLGAVRLELLTTGTWREWDLRRLARSGGTLEQYKHPCLIPDLNFRDSMRPREIRPGRWPLSLNVGSKV